MYNVNFQRTSTERGGDSVKTVQHDRSAEQEARVKALTEKVKCDYFDSGIYKIDKCKAQGGGIDG